MDYIIIQILTAMGVFLALISCAYFPYCVIQYRARSRSNISRRSASSKVPVLSLCNCFAAGVFLATCFVGMVPHVREHVTQWNLARRHEKAMDDSHKEHETPWTEILLISGFLMILLFEEMITLCRRYCCFCRRRSHRHQPPVDMHIARLHPVHSAENEPLMSDSELGSGSVIGNNGKATGLDSPLTDSIRMTDMDGHLHGQTPSTGSGVHQHHHHSHNHSHLDPSLFLSGGGDSLAWRSVALLLGLGIHGIFEGMALGLQDQSQALFGLLVGVMSHEALCAIAFGINLARHRARAGAALLSVVLFSLSIPFGMAVGFVMSSRKSDSGTGIMIRMALEGLAAGTFVYVAFMDMLAHELATGHDDEEKNPLGDRWRLPKVLCVSGGFLLFLGFTFVA